MAFMGELEQESLNFRGAHLAGVALFGEKNEAAPDAASLIENFFRQSC
jgi:hypothetical protein